MTATTVNKRSVMIAIIKKFKEINISLSPAGKWEFRPQGKQPIDPNRKYGLSWESYPTDNMAKFAIEKTPYIIVDNDGEDTDIESYLPSIADTFYTVTTKPYKRHYYMLPPKGIEKTNFRLIKWRDRDVDILTTGTLFEGHGKEILTPNKEVVYTIHEDSIKRFSEAEWKAVTAFTPKENKFRGDAPLFFNFAMKRIGEKYVNGEKLSPKEVNSFFHGLGLLEEITRKRNVELLPLSYDRFNKAVSVLFFNSAIDTEISRKIAEKILTDKYSINLKSAETAKRFYGQIVPSLPTHQSVCNMSAEHDIETRLDGIADNDITFVKFIDGRGIMKYVTLSATNYEIIKMSADGYFLTDKALATILKKKTADFIEWETVVPLVRLIDSPFKPHLYFDTKSYMDTLNISRKTRYQIEAVATPTAPDNVLMRVIESYMGTYTPLYLAWLAQVVFGDTPPNTILLLVSAPDVQAGTGKTTLASSIPQNLAYSCSGITETDVSGGWGDFFIGKSLVSINDARNDDLWKNTIYPTMRDETTGGIRKQRNKKYGGIVETNEAVAFALSANYIPSIDPHDRRCLIIAPQFLAGKSKMLSEADSTELNRLIERTGLDEFKPEFMELAHHLKWWAENGQFERELNQKAPETPDRAVAVTVGRGYGRMILDIVSSRVEELHLYMVNRSSSNLYPITNQMVATYIGLLAYEQKNVDELKLPLEFLGNLLALVQNKARTTPASILSGLGINTNRLEYGLGAINKDKLIGCRLPLHTLKWEDSFIRVKIQDNKPIRKYLASVNRMLSKKFGRVIIAPDIGDNND